MRNAYVTNQYTRTRKKRKRSAGLNNAQSCTQINSHPNIELLSIDRLNLLLKCVLIQILYISESSPALCAHLSSLYNRPLDLLALFIYLPRLTRCSCELTRIDIWLGVSRCLSPPAMATGGRSRARSPGTSGSAASLPPPAASCSATTSASPVIKR
jgi:hypothetical protein